MKEALLVNAIDPSIGGVLIRGDKGTGKSTAVRALADLLPDIKVVSDCPFNCHPEDERLMCSSCRERYRRGEKLPWIKRKMEIVELPLSATEDMVVGTIDIKRALKEGIKALEPGILARANRNILYVDEVNLLEDHLVDILLDSAAMGVNIVEREGVSVYHPSRFVLIGTMNPEEGELRPQFLDRFGLCVDVEAVSDKQDRLVVMEYRRMFDRNPWKFKKMFEKQQNTLRKNIVRAQNTLDEVKFPKEMLEMIVDITTSLGIKTHRADIVMEKTSRVLASLDGRDYVTEEDIKKSAILALTHRIKQKPFEKSSSLRETIDKIFDNRSNGEEETFDFDKEPIESDLNYKMRLISNSQGRGNGSSYGSRGRYIGARESSNPTSVAVDATIRKAVRETGKLEVLPEHIMEKIRVSRSKSLYTILIDSSSSMKVDMKIKFAKRLVWTLLKNSYENKNLVSIIVCRGEEPQVLVYPTKNVEAVLDVLEKIPTGGRTPITPSIYRALELSKKVPDTLPTIILISDGRANVYIKGDLKEDIRFLQDLVKGVRLVFVNTENSNKSIGVLEELSSHLGAYHLYVEELL